MQTIFPILLILVICFFSYANASDEESKLYVLELNSSNGSVTNGSLILDSIKVETDPSYAPDYRLDKGPGRYECRIFSFNDRLLTRFYFQYPDIIFWDSTDTNTGMMHGGMDFVYARELYVEYFPNAKEINFYDPQGNLALSVDVSRFSAQTTTENIKNGENDNNEMEVVFHDPNLEAKIRKAINRPEGSLYASDLVDLKVLKQTREESTMLKE